MDENKSMEYVKERIEGVSTLDEFECLGLLSLTADTLYQHYHLSKTPLSESDINKFKDTMIKIQKIVESNPNFILFTLMNSFSSVMNDSSLKVLLNKGPFFNDIKRNWLKIKEEVPRLEESEKFKYFKNLIFKYFPSYMEYYTPNPNILIDEGAFVSTELVELFKFHHLAIPRFDLISDDIKKVGEEFKVEFEDLDVN